MQSIKVSVIIPCYNVEAYISECLDSVLAQTYTNVEIICVDNGSSDDTVKIIESYNNSEIKLFYEPKQGAPYARNLGLEKSEGDWIQFLDADDLLLEDKIANQVKLISDENISFIYSSHQYREVDGSTVYKEIKEADNCFFSLFKRELGNTCSNLFNKEYLNKTKGWNTKLSSSQETDLMFRLLKENSNCMFSNENNTIVRARNCGQISHQSPIVKWSNFLDVRYEILIYLNNNRMFLNLKDDFLSFFLASIFILKKYDTSKAMFYAKRLLEFNISKLKPIGGLKPKTIKIISIIGLRNFLMLHTTFTKIKNGG